MQFDRLSDPGIASASARGLEPFENDNLQKRLVNSLAAFVPSRLRVNSPLLCPNRARHPRRSAVVPVYNSEGTLADLMPARTRPPLHASSYEVILVNDGSRDRSWQVVTSWPPNYPLSAAST